MKPQHHQRWRVSALLILIMLQAGSQAPAQTPGPAAGLDAARLDYVERLVMQPTDFVPQDLRGDAARQEEQRLAAAQEKRRQEIKTAADLKPYLLALLDQYYVKDQSPDAGQVLSALALREDLTEADVAPVKQEIRRLTGIPYDTANALKIYYLMNAARVLGTKKTEENEELALAILNHSRDMSHAGMVLLPAEVLGRIGTARSIAPLEAALAWMKEMEVTVAPELRDNKVARIQAALTDLKMNLAAGAGAGSQGGAPLDGSAVNTGAKGAGVGETWAASETWPAVVVLAVAFLGLIWLYGRKLRK